MPARLEQAIIGVHIAAGLTAVICGIVAMRAPKGPGRHPHAGLGYMAALAVVAATATIIVFYRPHTAYLLVPGALALAAAGLGYAARRVRWRGWLRHHITCMAVSYTSLLTAFYVDNGPRLPLWNLLPPLTFWFLPAAIAAPLLARALHRRRPAVHRERQRPAGQRTSKKHAGL